ncbi:MAG: hypothetical protein HQL87_05480 [Magnetococcales bacterium]|nr:hypothetical protein [Magnetococcales bacterium]
MSGLSPHPAQHPHAPDETLPYSPFAWSVGRRLGVVAVLIVGLWLAVAVALDWLGGHG